MDLRGVLPGKEVAAGDTWDIDVQELRALLAPGGDVGIRPEKVGDEEMGGMMPGMDNMGELSDMLGETLEGTATAEYKGVEEKDGGRYGVIRLTFEIKSNNDMADKVGEMMKEMPENVGNFQIDHMDVEFGMNATGTIYWDMASGHVHSADVSGEVEMNMDTGMAIEAEGKSMNIEQTMRMSGTIAIQLEVTKG
jgi:hypothetical protein